MWESYQSERAFSSTEVGKVRSCREIAWQTLLALREWLGSGKIERIGGRFRAGEVMSVEAFVRQSALIL